MEEYRIFKIPKKSGGFRTIEAPCPELKEKQKRILAKHIHDIPLSPFCHAFRSGHSIVTACSGHIGAPYLLRFDLSNFFPSITKPRWLFEVEKHLRNNFRSKDYATADVNCYKRMKVIRGYIEDCFFLFPGESVARLPQGAPTSPWLSNAFLTHFDYDMAFACQEASKYAGGPINYSRYADDLCISGTNPRYLWALYYRAVQSLKRLGLEVNKKKTHMFKPGQRHMCVGLVVNTRPQPRRRWRRNLRAEIHNQEVAGKPLKASTRGKINFLNMCRMQESLVGSYMEITARTADL